MILELIVRVLSYLGRGLLLAVSALVPAPPDWFSTAVNSLRTVMQWLSTLEHWVPVNLTLTVAGAVVATYLVTMLIELGRMILSYVTFGGGAK